MDQEQAPIAMMAEDWQTALAIVAHPDDMEYGAAAAVAKWTAQGKKVVYVMASRGEAGINDMHPDEVGPLRSQEEIDAARVAGVDVVEFLDHKDGVIEYGLPLTARHQPLHQEAPARGAVDAKPSLAVSQWTPEPGGPPERGRGRVRRSP